MSDPSTAEGATVAPHGVLERQGIARPIAWGYLALVVFMIGDGIEAGFLSPYLVERGFDAGDVALLWSVYGFVVAVAAWLSGALAEAWGPRRVMMTGFAIWVVFELVFLGVGVATGNFAVMLISFGIRGLGYPLFAYGFLVWVAMVTPAQVLGRAVGWYWFASTTGLGVISSYFAGATIPVIGELLTLWSALAFVVVGGVILLVGVRSRPKVEATTARESVRRMVSALTIVWERPRVGVCGVLRIINTLSFYGFVVFMGTHMVNDVGFSLPAWQAIWGTMLLVNVLGNLVAGYAADWLGRVRVVAWGGGAVCAVATLGMYYVPAWAGPNFWAVMVVAVLLGIGLAAYVPLSAIAPLLAPHRMAAAIAVLSLGAGLSQFFGSALGGLVGPFGVEATIWVIAVLYAVSVGLSYLLREGNGAATTPAGEPAVEASTTAGGRPESATP